MVLTARQREAYPFLRTLRENPDDEAPRLIFADWLDEQNDDACSWRAQMLRGTWDNSGPSRFITTFGDTLWDAMEEHAGSILLDGVEHWNFFDGRELQPDEILPVLEFYQGLLLRVTVPLACLFTHGLEWTVEHPIQEWYFTDVDILRTTRFNRFRSGIPLARAAGWELYFQPANANAIELTEHWRDWAKGLNLPQQIYENPGAAEQALSRNSLDWTRRKVEELFL